MQRKDSGFTFVETLIATLLLFSILSLLIPALTFIKLEQAVFHERLRITSALHDDLSRYLWEPQLHEQVTYSVTPHKTQAEFSFTLEGDQLKGCATWQNAKQKREEKCLYGLLE